MLDINLKMSEEVCSFEKNFRWNTSKLVNTTDLEKWSHNYIRCIYPSSLIALNIIYILVSPTKTFSLSLKCISSCLLNIYQV